MNLYQRARGALSTWVLSFSSDSGARRDQFRDEVSDDDWVVGRDGRSKSRTSVCLDYTGCQMRSQTRGKGTSMRELAGCDFQCPNRSSDECSMMGFEGRCRREVTFFDECIRNCDIQIARRVVSNWTYLLALKSKHTICQMV